MKNIVKEGVLLEATIIKITQSFLEDRDRMDRY